MTCRSTAQSNTPRIFSATRPTRFGIISPYFDALAMDGCPHVQHCRALDTPASTHAALYSGISPIRNSAGTSATSSGWLAAGSYAKQMPLTQCRSLVGVGKPSPLKTCTDSEHRSAVDSQSVEGTAGMHTHTRELLLALTWPRCPLHLLQTISTRMPSSSGRSSMAPGTPS